MAPFKLALLQMKTGIDRDENIQKAEDLVVLAAGQGADLVVLPEMFSIPLVSEWMLSAMEGEDGPLTSLLCRLAADNRVNLVAGSIPEQAGERRCRHTCLYIDREGNIPGRYHKLHSYGVRTRPVLLPDADVVETGGQICTFAGELGGIGLALSYDLYFDALFYRMADRGARLIVVPAAFSSENGPDHWELLIRARALDNQVFVAACAPAPDPSLPFKSYGHSMVVDPWGRVLDNAGAAENILYTDIDFGACQEAEQRLPLARDHRADVY